MKVMEIISEPHIKQTFLRDVILGGQDGLVNVLGIILGVGIASLDTRLVLIAGLAATFAESVSMAAVAYTSETARGDHYEAELAREKREVEEIPGAEREEIRDIYRKKGFSGRLLEEIVAKITSDKKIWVDTMMREELNLEPVNQKDALKSSLIVGSAAVVGSLIPLSSFFFLPVKEGIVVSLAISSLALFLTGFYKGLATTGKPLKSGLQLFIIGMTAALIGYLIGLVFR